MMPQASGRARSITSLRNSGGPAWRANAAPIVQWARAGWVVGVGMAADAASSLPAGLSLGKLDTAWRAVARRRPSIWAQVSGPIGAAHLSCLRVGWRMLSPSELEDHQGSSIHLPKHSPAL
eukprot:7870233-Lingulodinium_polyedra.AAC.1